MSLKASRQAKLLATIVFQQIPQRMSHMYLEVTCIYANFLKFKSLYESHSYIFFGDCRYRRQPAPSPTRLLTTGNGGCEPPARHIPRRKLTERHIETLCHSIIHLSTVAIILVSDKYFSLRNPTDCNN